MPSEGVSPLNDFCAKEIGGGFQNIIDLHFYSGRP
jgi:hypothetical protein